MKTTSLTTPSGRNVWHTLKHVLGPGLLFAACAIGVSHLVQSTRAGAEYGFALLPAILAANIFKFPFFEFGSRYACSTGQHILEGYRKQGRWTLVLYLLVTLVSMFTVSGAVSFVCAGLLANLFGITLSVAAVAALLLLVCILILITDNFSLLDGTLKILSIILLLTTLAAVVLIFGNSSQNPSFFSPKAFAWESMLAPATLPFLIALMGWMPTAVDLSAWNSLWTIEKIEQSGYHPSLKETLFDFNLGYWFSAGLSFCFVALGAYVMFDTEVTLADNSVGFAGQLVSLYTTAIGPWCYPIIAVCATTVMFSTVLTVLDGYGRALPETLRLLKSKPQKRSSKKSYALAMLITAFGAWLLIYAFTGSMRTLVDLATILSFLIAPIIAIINYRVMHAPEVAQTDRPGKGMRWLALAGILYLSLFTLLYLGYLFL